MQKPMLVFQTDFTYLEAAVSAMYGVVKTIDRELEIFDNTHEIPQYDIWSASFRLFQPLIFWPKGTVFVSVVDPGVGTDRKASIAETNNGYYIVTPDNGSLTHVAHHYGIKRVVEIDLDRHRLKGYGTEEVTIFHGRDVFAYCAAQFASDNVQFEEFGTLYDPKEIVQFDLMAPTIDTKRRLLTGNLEIVDPNFGNAWTNIPMEDVKSMFKDDVHVKIYNQQSEVVFDEVIQVGMSFGDVGLGELMIYQNEYKNASLALNQASFIKQYAVPYGEGILVEMSAVKEA